MGNKKAEGNTLGLGNDLDWSGSEIKHLTLAKEAMQLGFGGLG